QFLNALLDVRWGSQDPHASSDGVSVALGYDLVREAAEQHQADAAAGGAAANRDEEEDALVNNLWTTQLQSDGRKAAKWYQTTLRVCLGLVVEVLLRICLDGGARSAHEPTPANLDMDRDQARSLLHRTLNTCHDMNPVLGLFEQARLTRLLQHFQDDWFVNRAHQYKLELVNLVKFPLD
ncbi:unnamed protein product, partial [Amoebophrya sp. A120]